MKDFCHAATLDLSSLTPDRCLGIKVFPKEAFYPLHWKEWRLLFDTTATEEVLARSEAAYAVHTWGRETRGVEVKGEGEAYFVLAKRNCPVVYRDKLG